MKSPRSTEIHLTRLIRSNLIIAAVVKSLEIILLFFIKLLALNR